MNWAEMTKGFTQPQLNHLQQLAESGADPGSSGVSGNALNLFNYFQGVAKDRIKQAALSGQALSAPNAWKNELYNQYKPQTTNSNQGYGNQQQGSQYQQTPQYQQQAPQQDYTALMNQMMQQQQQQAQGQISQLNQQWQSMLDQSNSGWQGKLDLANQSWQDKLGQAQSQFDQSISGWQGKYDELTGLMTKEKEASNTKYQGLLDKYNYLGSVKNNQTGAMDGQDNGTGGANKNPQLVSNVTKENTTNQSLYKYLNNIWNGGF